MDSHTTLLAPPVTVTSAQDDRSSPARQDSLKSSRYYPKSIKYRAVTRSSSGSGRTSARPSGENVAKQDSQLISHTAGLAAVLSQATTTAKDNTKATGDTKQNDTRRTVGGKMNTATNDVLESVYNDATPKRNAPAYNISNNWPGHAEDSSHGTSTPSQRHQAVISGNEQDIRIPDDTAHTGHLRAPLIANELSPIPEKYFRIPSSEQQLARLLRGLALLNVCVKQLPKRRSSNAENETAQAPHVKQRYYDDVNDNLYYITVGLCASKRGRSETSFNAINSATDKSLPSSIEISPNHTKFDDKARHDLKDLADNFVTRESPMLARLESYDDHPNCCALCGSCRTWCCCYTERRNARESNRAETTDSAASKHIVTIV